MSVFTKVAAGLVLLMVLATLSCSDLPQDALDIGWYIRLNVGPPAASRGVSVSEYDVTGLTIVVLDPDQVELRTIDWAPADGEKSYLLQVDQAGDYELVVTHRGTRESEQVEVTESVPFSIQAMIVTIIDIVPGLVGQIRIDTGEPPQPQEDGSITVTFSQADVANGHDALMGVYPAGTDPMIDPLGLLVATGGFSVTSGQGSTTLTQAGDGLQPVWYGAGGASYDLYIWVDMNDNLEYGIYWQEPGIDLQLSTFPVVVTIDGDQYLSYTGSDLEVTPSP